MKNAFESSSVQFACKKRRIVPLSGVFGDLFADQLFYVVSARLRPDTDIDDYRREKWARDIAHSPICAASSVGTERDSGNWVSPRHIERHTSHSVPRNEKWSHFTNP
jgi:hypothetical protein